MRLQDTIKDRRKRLQLNQNDLAQMAGISLATIKDIERGAGNPSWNTIENICEVLGLSISFSIKQTV